MEEMSNIELIEKFLHKELNLEEEKILAERLKSDSEFADELEYATYMHREFNNQQKERWNQLLENKTLPNASSNPKATPSITPPPQPNIFKRILKIAAVLFLIAAPLLLLYYSLQPTSFEQMARKALQENRPAPMVVRSDNDHRWTEAMDAYQNKEYTLAAQILEDVYPSTSKEQDEISYYLGLCYLFQKSADYAQASQKFDLLLNKENNFQEEVKWYQSLSLLMQNKKEQAQGLLSQIVAQKAWKHTEAQKLLDAL